MLNSVLSPELLRRFLTNTCNSIEKTIEQGGMEIVSAGLRRLQIKDPALFRQRHF
jgi:hypothetical protein